jgi:Domain of unknown function (DUF4403)
MRPAMRLKTILLAAAVIAVSFFVSLKAMDWLAPRGKVPAPALVALPPLPVAPRSSIIVVPVTVAISAIRDAAERGAPRTFSGKADNPAAQILQNADIGWTASRGAITASGAQDALTLATPLTGTLNVTGSLSSKAKGVVGNALGSLLGGNVAKQIGSVNIKALNASAEIKGNVTITTRPKLAAAWHFEPNMTAQVTLNDSSLSVAGARVNVPAQVKWKRCRRGSAPIPRSRTMRGHNGPRPAVRSRCKAARVRRCRRCGWNCGRSGRSRRSRMSIRLRSR